MSTGSTDVMESEGDTGQGSADNLIANKLQVGIDPRPIMNALLDISEEQSEKQLCQARVEVLLDSSPSNLDNQLHGWLTPPSNPQKVSINTEQKKRKSNPYTGASDIDDFYLFKKKSYLLLPDYWHPGVMWRSIVEADTFRYVADNGCYRYLKTNAALGKDKNELKSQFQKRPLPLAPSQREIQREITRDLRRVVESQERRAKSLTPKGDSEVKIKVASPVGVVDEKLGSPEDEPEPVSEEVMDIPSAGVGREGAESPFQLPSMDVPLLSKAFAERLMENFSSKISALEEQIRKDAKLKTLQKSTETMNINQIRRSSLQDLSPESINAITQANTPSLDKKGSFPQSTFQVIKVYTGTKKSDGKPPLKPLEKVTPNLRQLNDTHKMQVAHLRYNSVKGNSDNCTKYSFSDSVINPVHLKEDLVPSDKMPKESDGCLNINNIAVLGAMKSGDAGISNRSSSQPLSVSKPSHVTVSKPKRSKSFFNEPDKSDNGFHSAPVGKPKREQKKSGVDTQDLARRVLPELMGKKMPVTVSVQKWL